MAGVNMNLDLQNAEFRMNRGDWNYAPGRHGSQVVRRSPKVFKGVYNFAQSGGAVGNINLMDPVFASLGVPSQASPQGGAVPLNLPASFIISKVLIDVITSPTSGGSATIALSSGQTAADLLAATAYGSLTAGLYDGIPAIAAAGCIKIPATQAQPGSGVYLTVGTAALTAGLINVHIFGFLSD